MVTPPEAPWIHFFFSPSSLALVLWASFHAGVWEFGGNTKNHWKWPYRVYQVFTVTQPGGFVWFCCLSIFPILVLSHWPQFT